ncbi:hypothetical protein I203_102238 [Kwoniella mangroviensis CBS 8507]|uniref:uncharacterized protein n=1 Tax=Kwoniella mangroviensis CBS 8507 TaxID=1296122 RepID=UPI00080D1596|nr:uncharacterized protein I203_03435 [Kwoniella mangroviensis CBS 8507]OCF67737.1 hypothetical protein I203_03435 [Kwoniella mangroviensis CBS 8507]
MFDNDTYPSSPTHDPTDRPDILTLNHNPTRPTRPYLPLDIFLLIRSILITDSQKATAARLMQSAKIFYEIFLPVLQYGQLELRGGTRGGNGVFEGLMMSDSDDEVGQLKLSPFSTYPFPIPSTHQRKLSLLQQCRHLTIYDLPSALSIIQAQRSVGKEDPIFPNVKKVIFGSELILSLAMELDKEGCEDIQNLSEFINPQKICIWYPSPITQPIRHSSISPSYSVYQNMDYVQLDENRFYEIIHQTSSSGVPPSSSTALCCGEIYDKSISLRCFISSFRPSSLTLHNVNMQSMIYIPSVRQYKVFYATSPQAGSPNRCSILEDIWLESMSLKRAVRITQGLPWNVWKEDGIERKFMFVDAELSDYHADEEDIDMEMDSHSEVEEGEIPMDEEEECGKVEKLVKGLLRSSPTWNEQSQAGLSFVRRVAIDRCDCCGTK